MSLASTCHPDRPTRSYGLCSPCYSRRFYRRSKGLSDTKVCPTCGGEFAFFRGQVYCSPDCANVVNLANARAYMARRRATDPTIDAAYSRKSKYGITPEEYDRMHADQGGRCGICKQYETATLNGRVKRLAVDHDHETGAVRALLCSKCNMGGGNYNEDPSLLIAAAAYFAKHRGLALALPVA